MPVTLAAGVGKTQAHNERLSVCSDVRRLRFSLDRQAVWQARGELAAPGVGVAGGTIAAMAFVGDPRGGLGRSSGWHAVDPDAKGGPRSLERARMMADHAVLWLAMEASTPGGRARAEPSTQRWRIVSTERPAAGRRE